MHIWFKKPDHLIHRQSRLKICAGRNGMITMKTLTIQPLLFVAIDRGAHTDRSQPAYQNQA